MDKYTADEKAAQDLAWHELEALLFARALRAAKDAPLFTKIGEDK